MAMVGMDIDAVENIGRQMQTQADAIGHVISQVESLISQAEHAWKGGDADSFRDTWHSHYKGPMTQAQNSLHGLGQSALHNANEQRSTSGH